MTLGKEQSTAVWVLTRQHQLQKVDATGSVQDKSPTNFGSLLSFSADQTLWVMPNINEATTNQILYSEDEGRSWIEIDLQQIKAVNLAATHLGSCFVVTAQGAVHLIQKSGQIELVFAEGTANDIAVSPDGFIWLISMVKKVGGGNLVFWCTYGNFSLQPAYGEPVAKKISAGIEGSARIITTGGEIASLYVTRMSGLETPGGDEFAKEISTSNSSNTIWAICTTGTKKHKKFILKYWNPDLDSHMKWHTILDIEPLKISGAD